MEYSEVKDLIKTINESSITKFQLEIDNVTVKIEKNAPTSKALRKISIPTDVPITIMPEENTEISGHVISSPIVGTFYESSGPSAPPFVKQGDKVKKGDILCILEAMKVMNEIVSDTDGVISEVFVKNEEMVEYKQPLYKII